MAKDLTERQREILSFIITRVREDRQPPTIAEIGERFSISSTNAVRDHLLALERKGFIDRYNKARGIHITEKAVAGLYQSEVGLAPLLGRIAAGQPLLAEENIEGYIPVSPALPAGKTYCLRVFGESMIEDGILDGDVIVVDASRTARPGNIVVALVEDEATVKHYHPEGNVIELRPANSAMRPMRYSAQQVQLQGVVVALQRELLH